MVSLVAHLEYLLYHLNPAPSIQVHPFLSHWVETVIRLQNRLPKVTALLRKSGTDDAAVLTWLLVQKTRLEVIRRILADETEVRFPRDHKPCIGMIFSLSTRTGSLNQPRTSAAEKLRGISESS